jgi:acyl-CoA reductase-like NAD-dependent aldehyde dehydrogenase
MAPDLKTAVETLRAVVIDSRAGNLRYRQNELFSLHAALRENADAICEAISKDASSSTTKAQTEFFLALDALRKSYESLDFDKSLKEEYSIKYGKDNVERRASLGLVAIKPSGYSRFYSVITPLVAALEAGNCVILEVSSIDSSYFSTFTDFVVA